MKLYKMILKKKMNKLIKLRRDISFIMSVFMNGFHKMMSVHYVKEMFYSRKHENDISKMSN